MARYDVNWPYRKSKSIVDNDNVAGYQLCFLKLHKPPYNYSKTPPSKDARIQEGGPDDNDGLNSAILTRLSEGADQRSVIEFDISDLPAGATILTAKLKMYYKGNVAGDPVGQTIWVHKLNNTAWIEGDGTDGVTWAEENHVDADHPGSCTDWTDGAPYEAVTPTPESAAVPAGFGWMEWVDIVDIAQDAVDNTNNVELLVIGTDSEIPTWYSKDEAVETAKRPILELTYSVVPADDNDNIYFASAKVKDYFDDLRVTDSDEETLLPYALRDVTQTTAELCVKVDVSANKDIYIYYGNLAACRASEPEEVFLFSQFMQESVEIDSGVTATHGICRLANDTLFAVLQVSADDKIYYSKSTNGGRTWSAKATVYDVGGGNECGQPMVAAIDIGGTEHIIVSFWQDGGALWDADTVSCIIISVDGGAKWGNNSPSYDNNTPREISPKGAGDSGRFIHCRVISYVEDSTQKLAVVTSNSYDDEIDQNGRIYFNYCTASDLTSWSEVLISDEGDEGNEGYIFAEPVILEVKHNAAGDYEGDFYVLTRCCASPYDPRCIYSPDYGEHWGNDHGGTPPYSNNLTDASGLTASSPDALDIMRSSQGDLIVVYAKRGGDDDGEIRLIKPSEEDMSDNTKEVTWSEAVGAAWANVWRSRETVLWYYFGYPTVCEIEDNGQFAVLFWYPGNTCNLFYVGKNAFVGRSFEYSGLSKLTWSRSEQAMQLEEAAGDNTPTALAYNPTQTDFILEWCVKTVDHDANDQNALLIYDDATISSFILIPEDGDNTAVEYYLNPWDDHEELYGSFVEGTKYKGRWKYHESAVVAEQLFDLTLLSDAWAVLGSAANKQSILDCPDIDSFKLGSGGSASSQQADSYWYWVVLRQYTASPPTWGATGSEQQIELHLGAATLSGTCTLSVIGTTGIVLEGTVTLTGTGVLAVIGSKLSECKIALSASGALVTMNPFSPQNHAGSAGWTAESKAYDEDLESYAYANIPAQSWSGWLQLNRELLLTIPPILVGMVEVQYSKEVGLGWPVVELRLDGAWVGV